MSTSTSSRIWARLISLNPEKSNINLLCEGEGEAEPSKAVIVPEKWMMRQHENGDTWITNLSESFLQIDDENFLKKDESEQVFGGERIAFERVEINDNQQFEYCLNLVHMRKNQLKRERKESPSVESKFRETEAQKKLKSCEDLFKSFACVVCSKIDEECVVGQPCMHNFCPSCLLDLLKTSNTCPGLGCGKVLKSVFRNKLVQNGFFLFKEGFGDLKIASNKGPVKLQRDLEGEIFVQQKGQKGGEVFIGPSGLNRKPSAYGLRLLEDGSLYQGNFSYGAMSGEGTITMPNGWCFKGHWYHYGLSDAEVSLNGEIFYRGSISNWQFHGKGVYTYSCGDVYDGEWTEGKKDGKGTMKYTDGNVYRGNWKDDLKEGEGDMKYENGDFYEGDWKDDKRNGTGKLIFPDGITFEGQWKDDLKDGEGALIVKNGDRYEGIWVKDEMQKGKVKICYANKDEYNGEIDVEKLQRNGKGALVKANGDQYVGQWRDDKQHGLGKETFKEDQSFFEGNWEKGRQVKGVLTESNGEKFAIEKKKVEKNRKFSSVI